MELQQDGQRSVEVWLVRHGETPRSAARRLAGWADVPLTDPGCEQARALRPVLAGVAFDGVWASDLQRAVTTARLAWGEPRTDHRLRELNFGDLEGEAYEALAPETGAALMRFLEFEAPGGESVARLEARASDFLGSLPAGRHLVFTHGGVIRALCRSLGIDRFVPTCTVVAVDWSGRRLLFERGAEPRP